MKKSKLQQLIEEGNYVVLAKGHGLNSRSKNSNIYHAIIKCGLNPKDEGVTFKVLLGGHAGMYRNDGYHFAIVKL